MGTSTVTSGSASVQAIELTTSTASFTDYTEVGSCTSAGGAFYAVQSSVPAGATASFDGAPITLYAVSLQVAATTYTASNPPPASLPGPLTDVVILATQFTASSATISGMSTEVIGC